MKYCGGIPYVPKYEQGWIGLGCNEGASRAPELTLEYEPFFCKNVCNSKEDVRIVGADPKNQTITCGCGKTVKVKNYLTWPHKCGLNGSYDPDTQKCVEGVIYYKEPYKSNGKIQNGMKSGIEKDIPCDKLCCKQEPVCNGDVPDWFERRQPVVQRICEKYPNVKPYKLNEY